MNRLTDVFLVCLVVAACTPESPTLNIAPLKIEKLPVPASVDSAQPNLFTTSDNTVFLTWIESTTGQKPVLKFSTLEDHGWANPKFIAQDSRLLANWADFPSLTRLNDGILAACWSTKNPKGSFATDVNIALSNDNGASWSTPFIAHEDRTPTEHGFVTLLPWKNNQLLTLWLDSRKAGMTTLRSAIFSNRGKRINALELDADACTCCQTDAALFADDRVLVAYRDHDANEKRDIAYLVFEKDQWSKPKPLHDDSWIIGACPVNGPALAVKDKKVAAAWYSAPNNNPEVKISFSSDGGTTFRSPYRIDGGKPAGRVDLVMLDDGSAIVSWLEQDETDAHIRVRHIYENGEAGDPSLLARSSVARTSGFPRMDRTQSHLIFAWVKPGEPLSIESARIPIDHFLAGESIGSPETRPDDPAQPTLHSDAGS